MRRPIYFKAKCISDGSWVTGSYWHRNEGDFIIAGECKFAVSPSTVCQFTGLKDCKGKDIYENVRYAIEWLDYSYILARQDKTKTINIQKKRIEKELCVIGNKFDRKEGEK